MSNLMENLEDLVDLMARALVDEPDAVDAQCVTEDDDTYIVELKVDATDIGKVIGKDGRTAQAMRTLLSAAAQKAGVRAHLDILD